MHDETWMVRAKGQNNGGGDLVAKVGRCDEATR